MPTSNVMNELDYIFGAIVADPSTVVPRSRLDAPFHNVTLNQEVELLLLKIICQFHISPVRDYRLEERGFRQIDTVYAEIVENLVSSLDFCHFIM